MATSIAPLEQEDPGTSNLRGFLLLFFVAQCVLLPYGVYQCFDEPRIIRRLSYLNPSAYTFHYIEAAYLGGLTVATVIGLFLILVRDPRTRHWWIALLSCAFALDVAHLWLVRELLHQHYRAASEILIRHGALASVIWLAYWFLSARVKVAFGARYAQPPVSYSVLGAVTAVAILIVLLAMCAGSLA